MIDVAGRSAFITGGASGIGLALGKALAAKGARVVLADIDVDALGPAARGLSGEVATVQLDVRDRNQWQDARRFAEERFGPVSLLANNAGIINDGGAPTAERGLVDQSGDSWDRMIGINLTGVFNGIATFGPGMRDRGFGHVVNTASTQGVITAAGVGSYCASKFGVVALSEALRQELEPHGVGVSVLCPGVIQTGLVTNSNKLVGQPAMDMPAGYGMDPAEVARLVIAAIEANRLYVFTHGEYAAPMLRRHRAMEAAIAEVPVSALFNPDQPLAGTPEFAAAMLAAGR
jgi:NAD(P)-dependent dehydrogenase (short-subunit alcohol dehydrogenase family)